MRDRFAAWWFRTFITGDRLCPCAFWWLAPLRPLCHWADRRAIDLQTAADIDAAAGETTYRTASGRELTGSDIQALADEAEAGYDVSHLREGYDDA